jgi:hypothetical protein
VLGMGRPRLRRRERPNRRGCASWRPPRRRSRRRASRPRHCHQPAHYRTRTRRCGGRHRRRRRGPVLAPDCTARHGHDPRPHRARSNDDIVHRCLRYGTPTSPPPQYYGTSATPNPFSALRPMVVTGARPPIAPNSFGYRAAGGLGTIADQPATPSSGSSQPPAGRIWGRNRRAHSLFVDRGDAGSFARHTALLRLGSGVATCPPRQDTQPRICSPHLTRSLRAA